MDISKTENSVRILRKKVEQWNKNYNHNFANDITDEIDRENKAIEHLLSEREQKDKKIKELEEERQLVGMPVKNKRDGRIGVVLHQWESGSVAVLENINPRIINTHDNWSTLEILTDEVKQTQTKCDSIPVQKVNDKIERYEYMLAETIHGEIQKYTPGEILLKIDTLKELLEEK